MWVVITGWVGKWVEKVWFTGYAKESIITISIVDRILEYDRVIVIYITSVV